jgi:hypothetical protein
MSHPRPSDDGKWVMVPKDAWDALVDADQAYGPAMDQGATEEEWDLLNYDLWAAVSYLITGDQPRPAPSLLEKPAP